MELLDADKLALKGLWDLPRERQRIQMILFQAIADSTDLTAKEVDSVINAIDTMLISEKLESSKGDQAL